MAIIGPMTSSAVKYTQPYFSGFHIPQFAPVATDPTFSFTPVNFPYLVRMSPSDTVQCQALAGIIEHYNWSQFALLVSKDDYGMFTKGKSLVMQLSKILLDIVSQEKARV